MSDPRRWWIEDNEANREVPADVAKPRYVEVMAVEDHDRIAAELKAGTANALKRVFNRQIGFLVSANAFRVLCEEIEKYDPFFKMPNSSERRRFVADRNAEMQNLKETIARQAKVIEKLSAALEECETLVDTDPITTKNDNEEVESWVNADHLREIVQTAIADVAAIEKEGAKDE